MISVENKAEPADKSRPISSTPVQGTFDSTKFSEDRLYITGIPCQIEKEEFAALFSEIGEISKENGVAQVYFTALRPFDKWKRGFVTFKDKSSVQAAIARFNGLEFKGGILDVKRAFRHSKYHYLFDLDFIRFTCIIATTSNYCHFFLEEIT